MRRGIRAEEEFPAGQAEGYSLTGRCSLFITFCGTTARRRAATGSFRHELHGGKPDARVGRKPSDADTSGSPWEQSALFTPSKGRHAAKVMAQNACAETTGQSPDWGAAQPARGVTTRRENRR